MKSKVANPKPSLNKANIPGTYKPRNAKRDAINLLAPFPDSIAIPLMICTPWLIPIANTKKGTNTEYKSMVKPIKASAPNCQTTATKEATIGINVPRIQREYINNKMAVKIIAAMKNQTMDFTPSSRSASFFGVPVM